MNKKATIIVIIWLSFFLISCSESLDIQLEPEVTVFFSHDSDKRLRLTSESKAYRDLEQWLHKHRSDWYVTSGRYPGGLYIKSGKDGIQITQTQVILYSTASPEPKALYIQKLSKGELSEFNNIGR